MDFGQIPKFGDDFSGVLVHIADVCGILYDPCNIQKLIESDVPIGASGSCQIKPAGLRRGQMISQVFELRLLRQGFEVNQIVLHSVTGKRGIIRNSRRQLSRGSPADDSSQAEMQDG